MSTDSRGNACIEIACGLAAELIRKFGEVRLCAFGTSMAPSILPGDLVVIQRAGFDEIIPGEVVLFSREGRLFIHRVIDRKAFSAGGDAVAPCLVTRGDRLCRNDPPISSGDLLGRVVHVERGRRTVELPAQPRGFHRCLARLLRTSDRATYLYLRLARYWRVIHA